MSNDKLLGKSRVQKGGNNGMPTNPKPKNARPAPPGKTRATPKASGMSDEVLHIKKKNLEAILLKIFRGDYWLWPACAKTKTNGQYQKVECRAGRIILRDEDPEDVLVVFNGAPGEITLGCHAGGFELEEGERHE